MPRLKNRNKCPINGFQLFQPELGKHYKTWSFKDLCDQMIADRLINPRFNLPTDRAAVESEADLVNAMRMASITGGEEYITGTTAEAPKPAPPLQDRLARLVAGADAQLKWIVSKEEAVPREQSTARAAVCVNCQFNDTKGDLLSYFTRPISAMILKGLELVRAWNLETPHDSRIGVCTACDCPLKLKVHIPHARIWSDMDAATKAGLPAWCWILKESQPKP
jgi:hypothetical protein